jgi:hypothetical protein
MSKAELRLAREARDQIAAAYRATTVDLEQCARFLEEVLERLRARRDAPRTESRP